MGSNPRVGGWFFRGLHEKYQSLNDRLIRLESTAITRESLESILDKKLDKLYDYIQKLISFSSKFSNRTRQYEYSFIAQLTNGETISVQNTLEV